MKLPHGITRTTRLIFCCVMPALGWGSIRSTGTWTRRYHVSLLAIWIIILGTRGKGIYVILDAIKAICLRTLVQCSGTVEILEIECERLMHQMIWKLTVNNVQ